MGYETQSRQKKILVLFAHPALQNSRVNRVFVEAIRDLDGVTFHDLYEAYPDFDVDVSREQELLAAHDTVVLQHPMFWYSIPEKFTSPSCGSRSRNTAESVNRIPASRFCSVRSSIAREGAAIR